MEVPSNTRAYLRASCSAATDSVPLQLALAGFLVLHAAQQLAEMHNLTMLSAEQMTWSLAGKWVEVLLLTFCGRDSRLTV